MKLYSHLQKKSIDKILQYSNAKSTTPGTISVLNTHGNENKLHPHIHVVMSAVGLSNDGKTLVQYGNELFDIQNYESVYITILKKALLNLHRKNPGIGDLFKKQVTRIKEKRVFISNKYDTADHLIEYLGRKIKGSSVSLSSIEKIENEIVVFKENQNDMSEHEFLRRYLLHILPPKIKSIRYSGLYGSSSRSRLEKAKELLNEIDILTTENTETKNDCEEGEDEDIFKIHKFCPLCKARMKRIERVVPFGIPRVLYLKYGKDPPPIEITEMFRSLTA